MILFDYVYTAWVSGYLSVRLETRTSLMFLKLTALISILALVHASLYKAWESQILGMQTASVILLAINVYIFLMAYRKVEEVLSDS